MEVLLESQSGQSNPKYAHSRNKKGTSVINEGDNLHMKNARIFFIRLNSNVRTDQGK